MKQVDQDLTFADAKKAPEQQRGKIFLLGGTVDARTDLPDRTRMRIRQHPVDTRYRPHVLAMSEGEFLVVIRPPVDPAQYPKGKRITMVGKLTGVEPAMSGGPTESLPSFEALFLRSWEPPLRRDDLSYDPNYLESSPGDPSGIGYGPYPYSYP